jgi:hypothetical protein
MPILPQPNVDLTDRDFASLRLRLIGLARSVFPTWTDFNTANFGNILLELFAFVGDVLNYYVDSSALNAYWPTMNQRIAAIRLGRLINFKLAGAVAATVDLTFSLPSVAAVVVTIPAGTRCRSKDPTNPVTFRTIADGTIGIGQSSVIIAAEQATAEQDVFQSSGAPNQEFTLSKKPYLDDSAEPSAANGAYSEVLSFLGSGPSDRTFVILVDQFDQGRVRFGNGANGEIPQGTITVDYKTGGGALGNVDEGQITIIEGVILNGAGQVSPLRVTNADKSSGGDDRMSLAQARSLGPQTLRTTTRTVSKDDFEINALKVAGVARSLMATSNESSAIQENTGILYVIAKGVHLASGATLGATPSSALLDEVEEMVTVTFPHTLTFTLEVRAAEYTTIAVSTRVYFSTGATPATVAQTIVDNLKDHFAVLDFEGNANAAVDFGANLKDTEGTITATMPWSDIFNVVRDTVGVREVDAGPIGLLLNSLRSSVLIGSLKFPKLGTMTILNADTGATVLTVVP